MGDYRKTYYEMMKGKSQYERALIEQPGLWECWLLENDEVVLIDMYKAQSEKIVVEPNTYMGKKVKKKLGAATYLFRALQMFEYYKENWWKE